MPVAVTDHLNKYRVMSAVLGRKNHVINAVTAEIGLLKEHASCMELEAWEYIVSWSSLPKGTNILPIKCIWVYKLKNDEKGDVIEFKSRLTPKVFKQKYGQDYFDIFAATGGYGC